jgi:hypothetical protein
MRIGLLPSTQWSSCGNGIEFRSEAELAQDVTKRLQPKLIAAGHVAQIFAGKQDANGDGAKALVSWGCDMAVSLHLDAASGPPAGLLCYQEERSRSMGEKILAVYCYEMGIKNKGSQHRVPLQKRYIPTGDGVAVLRIPEAAGIKTALIEMGDMNKPDGPNWLKGEHREKAADAMCKAICAVAGGAITQTGKEEDGMLYEGDGKKFIFEDCYVGRYTYWLHTRGKADEITFTLTALNTGISKTSEGQPLNGHKVHDMQAVAAYPKTKTDGSYTLECEASSAIHWALREIAK